MEAFARWLHMGGHGLYVWGSIGVVLGLMACESAALWRRARAASAAVGEGAAR